MSALAAHEWLTLLCFGGWVAMDSASLGQFMVSRPLVATLVAGFIVGHPADAAQLGLILEALHLRVMPIGAARYPEGGPAGVVGGAATALSPGWETMLTIVLFCLLWEWVGGETTRQLRVWNGRVALQGEWDPARVERMQNRALLRDFARGVGLIAVGLPLLGVIVAATGPLLAGNGPLAELFLGLAMLAGVAATVRIFGSRRLPYALAGAAITLAALWLR